MKNIKNVKSFLIISFFFYAIKIKFIALEFNHFLFFIYFRRGGEEEEISITRYKTKYIQCEMLSNKLKHDIQASKNARNQNQFSYNH